MPRKRRRSCRAATNVDPDPQNGSSVVLLIMWCSDRLLLDYRGCSVIGHHIKSIQSVCRKAINPGSSRHGFFTFLPLISHRANACAFICKSTSA